MRILAITVGAPTAGSTRFRLMQYQPLLAQKGIELEMVEAAHLNDATLDRIASADLVINQKCLLNSSWVKRIRKAARCLVFDFDDAIYTRPGKPYSFITRWRVNHRLKKWLSCSDLVITANEFLKNYAQSRAKRVEVIPMALDLTLFTPHSKPRTDPFTIGWAGAPNNLHHLERLDPLLQGVLDRFPKVQLTVFSGARPNLKCPFSYVNFTPNGEAEFIQKLDITSFPCRMRSILAGSLPLKPSNTLPAAFL